MRFTEQTKNQLYARGFRVFDGFCDREITVSDSELFAFVYRGEGENGIDIVDLSKAKFSFKKRCVIIEAYSDRCSVISLDKAIDEFLKKLSYTSDFHGVTATISTPSEDTKRARFCRKITLSANELTQES